MFRNAAAAASRNSDKREALKQFKSALNLLTKAQFKYDVTFNIVYPLNDNFYIMIKSYLVKNNDCQFLLLVHFDT